jgi:hypothetical protein
MTVTLHSRWSLPSNSVASAFPAACCGVSERMTNDCSLRIEDSPQLAAEIFNVFIGGRNDIKGGRTEKGSVLRRGRGEVLVRHLSGVSKQRATFLD